jgi:hypothetical protein
MRATLTVLLLGLLAALAAFSVRGQDQPGLDSLCDSDPDFQTMDFWLGQWDVLLANGARAGTNRIHKILKGCAILENWESARGSKGKSLFFFNTVTRRWKQVWVTDSGSVKEKTLIETLEDGGLRFQGEIPQRTGEALLDRTTLTPLGPDRVRQLIEISRDDGKTWQTTFDAAYVRRH